MKASLLTAPFVVFIVIRSTMNGRSFPGEVFSPAAIWKNNWIAILFLLPPSRYPRIR